MHIDKNAFYLSQRQYQVLGKDLKANNEKIIYWYQLLGKDVLQFLYENNPSVLAFLQDTPFDIDNSNYNIPSTQAEQSTIEMGTKDPQQPFPAFYTPWINTAASILQSRIGQPNNDLQNNFAELLLPKLQGISLRCLIMEMHQCRQNNLTKTRYCFGERKTCRTVDRYQTTQDWDY